MVHRSKLWGYKFLFNAFPDIGEPSVPDVITFNKMLDEADASNSDPTPEEICDFLKVVIRHKRCDRFIKFLHNIDALRLILPSLEDLSLVPQDKGRLRVCNALDHTALVMRYAHEYAEIVRFAAIFHDIGKYDSVGSGFQNHERLSAVKAFNIVYTDYKWNIQSASRLFHIIDNHKLPHDIQRENRITDSDLLMLKKRCHGLQNVWYTTQLCIADKRASHNRKDFLWVYYKILELIEVYWSIELYEREVEVDRYICPICAQDGETNILGRVFVPGQNEREYYCSECRTTFHEEAGRLEPYNFIVTHAEAEVNV